MYAYKFSMQESEKPRQLHYENDTVSLSFDFYYAGLLVTFINKSNYIATINWHQLLFKQNDTAKQITHILINEEREFYLFKPPETIAPKGKLADLLVFTDQVSTIKIENREVLDVKDMYPRKTRNSDRASAENMAGRRITLRIPFVFNSIPQPKDFHFTLA
jgi:hypothetical protein